MKYYRVATAQGKHREFSKFNFLHRENCGNTGNLIIFYTGKIVATQGKF